MTLIRICIWVAIPVMILSWAVLMSMIIEDVHRLIADPPSDRPDADL